MRRFLTTTALAFALSVPVVALSTAAEVELDSAPTAEACSPVQIGYVYSSSGPKYGVRAQLRIDSCFDITRAKAFCRWNGGSSEFVVYGPWRPSGGTSSYAWCPVGAQRTGAGAQSQ